MASGLKKVITSSLLPTPIGPYSPAVLANGNTLYISGQIGTKDGVLAEGIVAQTEQAMKNMGDVLKAAGATHDNVVKTTIFLQNYISDFVPMNEAYGKFFSPNQYPARAAFQVAALPKGALVEIEAIAVFKQ